VVVFVVFHDDPASRCGRPAAHSHRR
jgi:hypothetical protein